MSEYDKIADRAIPPDPDLLTALKMMLRSFERSHESMYPDERRACQIARAAIAKARGSV